MNSWQLQFLTRGLILWNFAVGLLVRTLAFVHGPAVETISLVENNASDIRDAWCLDVVEPPLDVAWENPVHLAWYPWAALRNWFDPPAAMIRWYLLHLCLWSTLDQELTFSEHMKNVCRIGLLLTSDSHNNTSLAYDPSCYTLMHSFILSSVVSGNTTHTYFSQESAAVCLKCCCCCLPDQWHTHVSSCVQVRVEGTGLFTRAKADRV